MKILRTIVFLTLLFCASLAFADGVTFNARTTQSGRWSDAATWENARMPKAGDRVQVRPGHVIVYDVSSDAALRMVHVGGVLTFSREKSTRLDVGLLKIQPGDEAAEDGFVCAVHDDPIKAGQKTSAVPSPTKSSFSLTLLLLRKFKLPSPHLRPQNPSPRHSTTQLRALPSPAPSF